MAISLYVRTISRGQGHSAVRAAAYCGRRRLYDIRRQKTFNYSRRPGLWYSELRLPPEADPTLADSGRLWNAIEAALTRANARLARELIIGLPRGRPLPAQIDLVQGFVEELFVARGHAVDWHVHGDHPRNPHVHALVSFPTLTRTGFGPYDPLWDRRIWLTGLHAHWRSHCARAGASYRTGSGCGHLHLGAAAALSARGVITRQGQRLAALRALRPRTAHGQWPAWLRPRLREIERQRHRRRSLDKHREGSRG